MSNFKKNISIFIVLIMFFACGLPPLVLAEESGITMLLENDFSENTTGLSLGAGNGTAGIHSSNGDSYLRMTGQPTGGYADIQASLNLGAVAGKPKIVLEFRYRVNNMGVYGRLGYDEMYGRSQIVACYSDKVTIAGGNTTDIIASEVTVNEWHRIMIIYDNVETNRTVIVDDREPVVVAGNAYAGSGNMALNFRGYLSNGHMADIDYLRIYSAPSTMTAEVINSTATELGTVSLLFNTIPAPNTLTTSTVSAEGATVSAVTVDANNNKMYHVEFSPPLSMETQYTLSLNGVKNIYGSSLTQSYQFTTRKGRQYVASIDVEGLSGISPGEYQVKTIFVNEYAPFSPVLTAALYGADGELKYFKAEAESIGLLLEGNVTEYTKSITLPSSAATTDILVLGYVKDKATAEPISGNTIYSSSGKGTETFNPAKLPYTEVPELTITPDPDTEITAVNINTKDTQPEREVALVVFDKGTQTAGADITVPGRVAYMITGKTTDGEVLFNIKLGGEGKYPVRAFVNGSELPSEEESISFYKRSTINTKFGEINQTASANDVEEFITTYGDTLGMDTTLFDSLKTAGSAHALEAIIKMRDELSGRVFSNTAEFESVIKTASLLGAVLEDKDTAQILESNYTDLGILQTQNDTFINVISDSAYNSVVGEIGGAAFYSPKELANKFLEAVVLKGIRHADSYIQVSGIINALYADAGLDLSQYNLLKSPEAVIIQMAGKSYPSLGALKTAFDALIIQQKNAETDTYYSPGGGGGGGGYSPPGARVEREIQPLIMPAVSKFNDLTGFEWAQPAIEFLSEKGIVSGRAENAFAPGDSITRAEFVKLVVSAFNVEGGELENPFEDVSQGDWYYPYILRAYQQKIASGTQNHQFDPNSLLTREMAAAILFRAFEYGKIILPAAEAQFSDLERVSEYALSPIGMLSGAGIIKGFSDDTVRPQNICSRAEATQLVYAALEYIYNI